MTRSTESAAAPFSHIKVRVAALLFCGNEVALIRRDRPATTHYTPPGGNVEPGEDLDTALARELEEELALDHRRATSPELLWVVDQRVSRPGATPPPRKLHLIYRLHTTPEVRRDLSAEEADELPDGSHEIGIIEWVDYRSVAELPFFPPPVGPALASLPDPHAPVSGVALSAVTDANYV